MLPSSFACVLICCIFHWYAGLWEWKKHTGSKLLHVVVQLLLALLCGTLISPCGSIMCSDSDCWACISDEILLGSIICAARSLALWLTRQLYCWLNFFFWPLVLPSKEKGCKLRINKHRWRPSACTDSQGGDSCSCPPGRLLTMLHG